MDDFEYLKLLNVLIAFASLAFVLALGWQARLARLRVDRAIVGLIVVFALRAVTRVLPPFGEDHPVAVGVLDTILLAVMVLLVLDGRRIVQALTARREAAEQSQIDYDLALHSLETSIAGSFDAELGRIEQLATAAAAEAADPATSRAALDEVASSLAELRRGGGSPRG